MTPESAKEAAKLILAQLSERRKNLLAINRQNISNIHPNSSTTQND